MNSACVGSRVNSMKQKQEQASSASSGRVVRRSLSSRSRLHTSPAAAEGRKSSTLFAEELESLTQPFMAKSSTPETLSTTAKGHHAPVGSTITAASSTPAKTAIQTPEQASTASSKRRVVLSRRLKERLADVPASIALKTVSRGDYLTKWCRKNFAKPHQRYFRVDTTNGLFMWESPNKSSVHTTIPLSEVQRITPGDDTDFWRNRPDKAYGIEIHSQSHTLRIACASEVHWKLWMKGLLVAHALALGRLSEMDTVDLLDRMWHSTRKFDDRVDANQLEDVLEQRAIHADKRYTHELFTKYDVECKGSLNHEQFRGLLHEMLLLPESEFYLAAYSTADQDFMTESGFRRFLTEVQHVEPDDIETEMAFFRALDKSPRSPNTEARLSVLELSSYFCSAENSLLRPSHAQVYQDMSQPLSCYWISSSHNTYLSGDQVVSKSAVGMYIDYLLRGCRCVELDCWDGPDGEPVLFHGIGGYQLSSCIPFRDVVQACKDYGFQRSCYPIILSLEMHCGRKQKKKTADILVDILGDQIYHFPSGGCTIQPSPEELKYYVIIKGKVFDEDGHMVEEGDEEDCKLAELEVMMSQMLDLLSESSARQHPSSKVEDGAEEQLLLVNCMQPELEKVAEGEAGLESILHQASSNNSRSSAGEAEHGIRSRKRCIKSEVTTTAAPISPTTTAVQSSVLEEAGKGLMAVVGGEKSRSGQSSSSQAGRSKRVGAAAVEGVVRGCLPEAEELSTRLKGKKTCEDVHAKKGNFSDDGAGERRDQESDKSRCRKKRDIWATQRKAGTRSTVLGCSTDSDDFTLAAVDIQSRRQSSSSRNSHFPLKRTLTTDGEEVSTTPRRSSSASLHAAPVFAADAAVRQTRLHTQPPGKGGLHSAGSTPCNTAGGPNESCVAEPLSPGPTTGDNSTQVDSQRKTLADSSSSFTTSAATRLRRARLTGKSTSSSSNASSSGRKSLRSSDGKHDEESLRCYYRLISLRGSKLRSFDEPRNAMDICSLAEARLLKLARQEPEKLAEFCQKYLLRVYPAGTRLASSNYCPILPWLLGVQFVALNLQSLGSATILNAGRFIVNGGCCGGYVLKPPLLLQSAKPFNPFKLEDVEPPLHLTVKVVSGHQLPRVGWGKGKSSSLRLGTLKRDIRNVYSPYVTVGIHGVESDTRTMRTPTVLNNGFNPRWGTAASTFAFTLLVPSLALIMFQVYNGDGGRSEFRGAACYPVSSLREGLRWVPLFDSRFSMVQQAGLLVYMRLARPPVAAALAAAVVGSAQSRLFSSNNSYSVSKMKKSGAAPFALRDLDQRPALDSPLPVDPGGPPDSDDAVQDTQQQQSKMEQDSALHYT